MRPLANPFARHSMNVVPSQCENAAGPPAHLGSGVAASAQNACADACTHVWAPSGALEHAAFADATPQGSHVYTTSPMQIDSAPSGQRVAVGSVFVQSGPQTAFEWSVRRESQTSPSAHADSAVVQSAPLGSRVVHTPWTPSAFRQ
jgi:hypothetical protein